MASRLVEARHRLITSFLRQLRDHAAAYKSAGSNASVFLEAFWQDWPQIAHAQRLAACYEPELCVGFAVRATPFLRNVLPDAVRNRWFDQAVAEFPRIKRRNPERMWDSVRRMQQTSPVGSLIGMSGEGLGAATDHEDLTGALLLFPLLQGLGCALMDDGRLKDSERALRKALRVAPKFVEGKVYSYSGVVQQWGIEGYAMVGPRLTPDLSGVEGDLGLVYHRMDKRRKAQRCLRRALKHARENGNDASQEIILCNLGRLYHQRGLLTESEHYLQESLQIGKRREPRMDADMNADTLNQLGLLHLSRGREHFAIAARYLEEGLAAYQALGVRRGIAWSLADLALLKSMEGCTLEAFALADKAVLAARLEGSKRVVEICEDRRAQVHSTAVLGLQPSSLPERLLKKVAEVGRSVYWLLRRRAMRSTLARLQASIKTIRSGEPTDVSEREFVRASARFPRYRGILVAHAVWLDLHGRNGDAVVLLQPHAGLALHDFDLACQFAWALADAGHYDLAAHWCYIADALDPGHPFVADTRAWLHYRNGELDAAWNALRPALRLSDKVAEIAYHAAAILYERGDFVESRGYAEIALAFPRPFSGREHAQQLRALTAKT